MTAFVSREHGIVCFHSGKAVPATGGPYSTRVRAVSGVVRDMGTVYGVRFDRRIFSGAGEKSSGVRAVAARSINRHFFCFPLPVEENWCVCDVFGHAIFCHPPSALVLFVSFFLRKTETTWL